MFPTVAYYANLWGVVALLTSLYTGTLCTLYKLFYFRKCLFWMNSGCIKMFYPYFVFKHFTWSQNCTVQTRPSLQYSTLTWILTDPFNLVLYTGRALYTWMCSVLVCSKLLDSSIFVWYWLNQSLSKLDILKL